MDRLLKATKSARQLTGDSEQSDNQEACSSSQGEVNESIKAIIEDELLWTELQRELRSSQVLTNACLQEAVQRFIEKKEAQLKRIKSKKQMPFRRMCSDSVIGRRFSPSHEIRLAQEEKEKNNRSSSLDNTTVVDATITEDDDTGDDHAEDSEKNDTFALAAGIYPMKELPVFQMPNLAALKGVMLRSTSKEVELQKEAEAAAAAKKKNLVEFRERMHRRYSMEKLDEKMATIKLALAPATLSEGTAIGNYDSDDDSEKDNKGEWRSEYERSLYLKSLLLIPQDSSSSFSTCGGSSQASSRWKSEDEDDENGNNNKEKTSEDSNNNEADEDDLICDFPTQPRKTRRKKFQQDHAFAA